MASCHSNHNFFALEEIVPKNVIILFLIICYCTSDSFLYFVTLIWCYDSGGPDIGGSDIGGSDIGGLLATLEALSKKDIGGLVTLEARRHWRPILQEGLGKTSPIKEHPFA